MKKSLLLYVCLISCKTTEEMSFTNISSKILNVQSKEHRFAVSAYGGRKLFNNKFKHINLSKSDTLFLIERIGDPDLEVWSNIWTSKRDAVFEYKRESEIFRDTVYKYNSWKNIYINNVEHFDTTTIDNHKILGGYRTFITQVIGGKEIRTFFFNDAKSSIQFK